MQHTSKVKIKQLFTVFQRHLVTEKLMGIIHYFRPCMDWSDVTLFLTATLFAVYCATTIPSRYTANPRRPLFRVIPPGDTTCPRPAFLARRSASSMFGLKGIGWYVGGHVAGGVMRWITDEKTVPLFSKIAVNGLLVENAGQTYTSSECIR